MEADAMIGNLFKGIVCGIGVICATTGCETTQEIGAGSTDGVFVHIKSGAEDKHDVLMGLRMAQLMAEEHPTLVYFDVDGIEIVLDDAPDLKTQPFGSSRAMMQDLLEHDAILFACPGCLQAAGHEPADLMDGVRIAEKDAFFGFAEGRILTIDY
jgi:predicted peroxiredoxin